MYIFLNGINTKWNAISLIQDLNSGPYVHSNCYNMSASKSL